MRNFIIAAIVTWGTLPSAHAQEDLLPPQIVHEPCEFYQKGERFTLVARFYDDSPIFDPKVIFRSKGEDSWRNAPFIKDPKSENFIAMVKRRDLRGPFEYFIETFDENGNGPARYGSPDGPVRVMPSENAPTCVQVAEARSGPLTVEGSSRTPVGAGGQQQQQQPVIVQTQPGGGGGEFIIVQQQPPPPKTGCDADDAPFYCSGAFWAVTVGVVLVAAGVSAWALLRDDGSVDCNQNPEADGCNDFTADVEGSDPTSVFQTP